MLSSGLVACSVRKDSPDRFTLLVASAEKQASALHEFTIGERHAKLTIEYGDFSDALQKAANALIEVINATIQSRSGACS